MWSLLFLSVFSGCGGSSRPVIEPPDIFARAQARWGVGQTATHPAGDLVQDLLLHYAETGDAVLLQELLPLEDELLARSPDFPYGFFLTAWTRSLQGDASGETALFSGLPVEYPVLYAHFFHRPKEEVLTYLRCNTVNACVLKAERRGENPPGLATFYRVGWEEDFDPSPVTCDSITVEPRSCPTDWRAFEHLSWVSHGRDRLRQWRPDRGMTIEEFSRSLGIGPGSVVADVGSELGMFTYPFSRVVGPDGLVYAVEIDNRYLVLMDEVNRGGGFNNIRLVQSVPQDVSLPEHSVDAVFMCELLKDILTQTVGRVGAPPDVSEFLASIHRALRPDGRFIVVDHAEEAGMMAGVTSGLPSVDAVLAEHGFVHAGGLKTFHPRKAIEFYQPVQYPSVSTAR